MYRVIIIFYLFASQVFADCEYMFGQYYTWGGTFDIEEYVFGEDNCCEEYPIPFCSDERVYFVKEDYADYNDPENWDVISPNLAITRADNRGLYNAITESIHERGVSPLGTSWRYGPTFGANSETAVDPVVPYGPWFTWGYWWTPPMMVGMYSIEDDAYYDIYVTSWTSGNNPGTWPTTGGGQGEGNGGGFSYWRSGPVDANPVITSIADVPDDQGGRVYLTFQRSMLDVSAHPNGIDTYTIQRFDSPNWVGLGSIGALGEPSYMFEATTLIDSLGQGNDSTIFRVIAMNYIMDYVFYSDSYGGLSVDNIPPGVPNGFNASWEDSQVYISWNPSTDEDFQYYDIEKDIDATFSNAQTFYTSDNFFLDQNVDASMTYYYRVRSIDDAGNQSEFSEIVQMSTLSHEKSMIIDQYMLHQNYPNPFNPITTLRYDLPEDSFVKVVVYDMSGNQVKTLINDEHKAGSRSVQWNATNNQGQPVSAGVYVYTIEAGDFIDTRKMILLK